ncbi:hypothetical protein V2S84_25000, partial [Azotobacter chroococcum]|nr:hypothetical protein [Azotobacter chroococcum]
CGCLRQQPGGGITVDRVAGRGDGLRQVWVMLALDAWSTGSATNKKGCVNAAFFSPGGSA